MRTSEPLNHSERRASELWQEYLRKRDIQTRNELIQTYLPLIRAIAERMRIRLAKQIEVEELLSNGVLGLIQAMNTFRPQRGTPFKTYCKPRVKGAMLDGLRSRDWVPRSVRSQQRKTAETLATFQAETGRTPSPEEFANRQDVSCEEATTLLSSTRPIEQISLHGCFANEAAFNNAPLNLPADNRAKAPATLAQRGELKQLLNSLPREDRLVVLLYYYEGMTMAEISAATNLSPTQVSQRHAAALRYLRISLTHPLAAKHAVERTDNAPP